MMPQSLIPSLLNLNANSRSAWLLEFAALATGVALMAALAQVSFPLPWTPVPITGQTLGVALIGLSWGRYRAPLVLFTYLLLGAIGLPFFALKGGFLLGPTFGYLVGMFLASFAVGWLADLGWAAKGFWRALAAAYAGSAITFICGLWGLSFFIPAGQLLMAGLIPFLPGDLIKNSIAALISSRLARVRA